MNDAFSSKRLLPGTTLQLLHWTLPENPADLKALPGTANTQLQQVREWGLARAGLIEDLRIKQGGTPYFVLALTVNTDALFARVDSYYIQSRRHSGTHYRA